MNPIYDSCEKCAGEDTRCDHKVSYEDRTILLYVNAMPRFNQGNRVHRYGMFLVIKAALERRLPECQEGIEPVQVKRT